LEVQSTGDPAGESFSPHGVATSAVDVLRKNGIVVRVVPNANPVDRRDVAIQTIAGCSGLGGLQWRAVRGCIERTLGALSAVQVTVFEPRGAAPPDATMEEPPRMTAGRAVLVGLVRQYQEGLLDPFVTLLELYKLMYFMQEAGEPLRLQFVRGPYGPYAENLRHVLQRIEGYYVSGYADGDDEPNKRVTLVPGAGEEAESFLVPSGDADSLRPRSQPRRGLRVLVRT
jgi:hypothetical protein